MLYILSLPEAVIVMCTGTKEEQKRSQDLHSYHMWFILCRYVPVTPLINFPANNSIPWHKFIENSIIVNSNLHQLISLYTYLRIKRDTIPTNEGPEYMVFFIYPETEEKRIEKMIKTSSKVIKSYFIGNIRFNTSY